MHIKSKQQAFCIYGEKKPFHLNAILNSFSWIVFRKINLEYY